MWRFVRWTLAALLVLLVGAIVWFWTPDRSPEELKAKYADENSRFVELDDGLTVHVRDQGPRDAPVVLLLHGQSASLQTWEPWVGRLTDRYRIVTMDQTGHGLTGPDPHDDYSAARAVEIVDGVADALDLDRFVIGGNSMGGWVSWNYALVHGDRLDGLLLIDAAGPPDAEPTSSPLGFRIAHTPGLRWLMTKVTPRSLVARSVREAVYNQAIVDDGMIDRYWELLLYPGNRQATIARFKLGLAIADPDALAHIDVPTLIMWGDEDRLIPLSAGRWFHQHIPGSEFTHYPDIGHIPMEEAADRSAADVRRWLGSLYAQQEPATIAE